MPQLKIWQLANAPEVGQLLLKIKGKKNRCQMQVSGVRSQKAVGITASANNMALKLTMTALGESKLKNSRIIFCLFNVND